MLIVVLLPILRAFSCRCLSFRSKRAMWIYLEAAVCANSALVCRLLIAAPEKALTVFRFTHDLSITLRLDGPGAVFAGLVAFLWPFAMLYSFEYMEHEGHEKIFFMFYSMTYGVTLGVAFASDMLSMYLFYELLTLVTVPLVMHTLTREAILASRKYLYYSLGGAAFAFIGLIMIIIYGTTTDFILGGVLDLTKIGGRTNVLLFVYVMAFLGIRRQGRRVPFNSWLPQAGVAPTPVTALLHAVAVVKSGAFAIIRLTYYSFGVDFLKGTWAQTTVMLVVMFTIVYGCSRAVKETHLKRRLAYSTISNLSYILFGVTIMTPLGLVGALTHLIFHAVIKICSFFCAGAIIHQTEKQYVHELDGMGYRMPCVFGIFTVSALALMGVPGLAGFISKWNLASAAVESGNPVAYSGIACLLVSALLTAVYMLSIVVRAFFPGNDFDYDKLKDVKDPNWKMLLPLFVFTFFIVAFGLHSQPLVDFFADVAAGLYTF